MKKLISLILVFTMVLAFAACGKAEEPAPETVVPETSAPETSAPEAEPSEAPGAEGSADTLGQTLLSEFKAQMENEPADMLSLAEAIAANPAADFGLAAVSVEPGYLPGFSSDITGFESAASFAPMIGSIAFVGYVFSLADDADVDGFMDTLKANADPRWNICVEADETVIDHVGSTVFFLMCPSDF